jgi:hypothetical protein
MNSIVTYFYPNKPGRRNTLQDAALWVGDNIVGYVRTELHMNKDALHALDAAKPKANETVLNSVELS